LHGGAVLRRDLRTADAVECRRWVGHLDERRKADAAMDVLLAQPRLFGAQAGVIHQRVEMRERLVMREFLELDAGWPRGRISVVGDKVPPPDLQRIHADFLSREIDKAFGDAS